ncbi:MAG: hypothetical protein AABX37_02855 [Nanoarchaeota archaeon]
MTETIQQVRLYDLGNTLLKMGHADYVFGRKPQLRASYELGDIEANLQYELLLQEGLQQGKVRLFVGEGVERKLAADAERGIDNAVFSTCLTGAVDAALEQTELRPYVQRVFSTFDYNAPEADIAKKSAATKTAGGFRAVRIALGNRIISYADDKIAELVRAREGLGQYVSLYRIGEDSPSDTPAVTVMRSIADIPTTHGGLQVRRRPMPTQRIRQGV